MSDIIVRPSSVTAALSATEAFDLWLPVIGPSSFVLTVRLQRILAEYPDGALVDRAALAASCGLAEDLLAKTLTRMARYGLIGLHLTPHGDVVEACPGWPKARKREIRRAA